SYFEEFVGKFWDAINEGAKSVNHFTSFIYSPNLSEGFSNLISLDDSKPALPSLSSIFVKYILKLTTQSVTIYQGVQGL
ncbi:MAG: hypothetical protein QXK24_04395, partial [Ignisphaera sp.]